MNRPPVAAAGEDVIVQVNVTVQLDGSASYDPEGKTLNFRWELLARPPSGTNGLEPIRGARVELTPDASGGWVVGLTVSDGELASERDVVRVWALVRACETDEDCEDDGLYCTREVCRDGDCAFEERDCSAESDECNAGVCDEGWDRCEAQPVTEGTDCGVCQACDGLGVCIDELTQDGDCPTCQECRSLGICVFQAPGSDVKDECAADECNTGACDGSGSCGEEAAGTECGSRFCIGLDWMRSTCLSGTCTASDLVEDCNDGHDCTTDFCAPASGCDNTYVSRCTDGVQNCDETDVDCGGSWCPPCPNGQGCLVDGDCRSGVCIGNTCQVPTCSDFVTNGSESDVDCGGSCTACPDSSACNTGEDCISGVCAGGICQAPACDDGVVNGGETHVDCGGSCPACGIWGGTDGTSWNDPNNWSGGFTPDASTSVVIPAGCPDYPVLNSDVQILDLTIEPGASLDADDNDIKVSASWYCSGMFLPGTGTVFFDGDGVVDNGDNAFHNFHVAAGHRVAGSNLDIDGDLTIDADTVFSGRHYCHSLAGDFTNEGTFTNHAVGLPNWDVESRGGWWIGDYRAWDCPDGNLSYSVRSTDTPNSGSSCVYFWGDGSYLHGSWWVGRVVSIPSSAAAASLSMWYQYWADSWGGGQIYVFDGDVGRGDPNPQSLGNCSGTAYGTFDGYMSWYHLEGHDLTPWIGKTIWIGYSKSMDSIGWSGPHVGISDHGARIRLDDLEITVDGVVNGAGVVSQGCLHFDGLVRQEILGTPQHERFGVIRVAGVSTDEGAYSRTELFISGGRTISAAYMEVAGKLHLEPGATLELGSETYGGLLRVVDQPGEIYMHNTAPATSTITAVDTTDPACRFGMSLWYSAQLDVNGLVFSGANENGFNFFGGWQTNKGTRTLDMSNVEFTNACPGGVHIRYPGRENLILDGFSFDDSFDPASGGHNVETCGNATYGNILTFTNWSGDGGGEAFEVEGAGAGAINW
jgi:hypothetical protein